jgi:hypothetical protein
MLLCIIVPCQIAEVGTDQFFLEKFIAWLFPVMYIIDMGVTLCTAVKANGQEIETHSSIAVYYLSSIEFWIDLVSAFPFDLLMLLEVIPPRIVPSFNVFRIFKMLKTINALGTLMDLQKKVGDPTRLRLMQMSFILVVVLHCTACMYLFVVKLECRWRGHREFFLESNDGFFAREGHNQWITPDNIFDTSNCTVWPDETMLKFYLEGLFKSQRMVLGSAGRDVMPVTITEHVSSTFVVLLLHIFM